MPSTVRIHPQAHSSQRHSRHVGFVFTKEDLTEIKGMPLANEVPATSGAKAVASCEVTTPSQNTATVITAASATAAVAEAPANLDIKEEPEASDEDIGRKRSAVAQQHGALFLTGSTGHHPLQATTACGGSEF
ncbi:hypothetical protein A6R68_17135 [Neotoma lepida]|uniref:Uncharacterized protein n=1 Tax=Neotoma lepida TaxID=56216 RepID=A0A1A6HFK6_NEOLE|nr:hypothetical protein A6R68_17135 [Neotoma lepida]